MHHLVYVPVRSYLSVLLSCSSACRNLRMIDVEDFHTRKDPIELFVFQKMISTRVDRVQGILLNRRGHLWSRHTLENERCDFTASVLDFFYNSDTISLFFSPSWLLDVQDIYYEESRKLLVPLSCEPANLESFFNSLAVLMTSQLQEFALESLRDYTSLISPVGDTEPTVSVTSHR